MDSISCHSMYLDINRRSRMPRRSTESTTVSSEARRRTPSMRRTMPHSQPSKSHRQRGVANQKPTTAGAAAAATKKHARLSLAGLHINEVLPARQISRDPSPRSGRTDTARATATSSGWISEALSLKAYLILKYRAPLFLNTIARPLSLLTDVHRSRSPTRPGGDG